MKKHIPNFITCLNLFSGCMAVVFAFKGNLVYSSYMVFAAAVADFLDGFIARALKAYSEIGKQLDSLADMVSFGFVPGVIVYQLLNRSEGSNFIATNLPYLPFLITVFSALRLAKFNIDTRQTSSFIGVPTPANTLFFASFPLILENDRLGLGEFILNPYVLVFLTLLMSYLLIAEIPLFALKFKNFKWSDNKVQFVFLFLTLALLAFLFYSALPFIIILYVVLSLLNNATAEKQALKEKI